MRKAIFSSHNEVKMITFEQAKQLAIEYIQPLEKKRKKEYSSDSLELERSVEFDKGWFFFFTSKLFLETHNITDRPIGLGPVIIGKESGDIYPAGSGGTEEYWIDKFNEYLQNQKPK